MLGAVYFIYASAFAVSDGPTGPVKVEVVKGDTLSSVAAKLEEAGVIGSALVFKVEARADGGATAIQTGRYTFKPGADTDVILAKLTAGLCRTFPKIRPDLPRDAQGKVLDHKLDDPAYNQYQGILGHFHVQQNKTAPGPAFRWDAVLPPPRP